MQRYYALTITLSNCFVRWICAGEAYEARAQAYESDNARAEECDPKCDPDVR
jgi:hypothetical protein